MSVLSRPDTPCRGTCSHNVGDDICRGCLRTIEEVRDWPGMTREQRRAAAQELKVRRTIRAKAFGDGHVAGYQYARKEIVEWIAATDGSTQEA